MLVNLYMLANMIKLKIKYISHELLPLLVIIFPFEIKGIKKCNKVGAFFFFLFFFQFGHSTQPLMKTIAIITAAFAEYYYNKKNVIQAAAMCKFFFLLFLMKLVLQICLNYYYFGNGSCQLKKKFNLRSNVCLLIFVFR